MLNLFNRVLFCTLLSQLLFACAVAPDATDSTPMASAEAWRLRGKLALILPDERLSANLNWHHDGNDDDLRLTSPLGTTVLILTARPGRAEIQVDGETHVGQDADALIQRLTGWPLPLSTLSQYLLGNVPAQDDVVFDDNGDPYTLPLAHPVSGEQWQLYYRGWQQQAGHKVPRQVELRRDNQRIKLALSHWQPEL